MSIFWDGANVSLKFLKKKMTAFSTNTKICVCFPDETHWYNTLKILYIVSDYISSSKMTSEICTVSKKLNSNGFLYIFR